MNKCDREQIWEYLDGNLSDAQEEAFEAHLLECQNCAKEFAKAAKLHRLLDCFTLDDKGEAIMKPSAFAEAINLKKDNQPYTPPSITWIKKGVELEIELPEQGLYSVSYQGHTESITLPCPKDADCKLESDRAFILSPTGIDGKQAAKITFSVNVLEKCLLEEVTTDTEDLEQLDEIADNISIRLGANRINPLEHNIRWADLARGWVLHMDIHEKGIYSVEIGGVTQTVEFLENDFAWQYRDAAATEDDNTHSGQFSLLKGSGWVDKNGNANPPVLVIRFSQKMVK